MAYHNRITRLFGIDWPIIQAGMVWVSGWRLASAVSQAGGLGLLGSGSMRPEMLQEHIQKMKAATDRPFGVNLPLIYQYTDQHIQTLLASGVGIVFTSAGNPKAHTARLKEAGITVVHVVSSLKFALKAAEAGVDAVVAEGFEAGGHNGREESTSMVLLQSLRGQLGIPVIAAGGITSGASIEACFALGAEGVQVGSRFAVTQQSSAHSRYKQKVIDSIEGDTVLTLKQLAPVRLIRNAFYEQVLAAESRGAGAPELLELLGKGRARRGIFEGDLEQGEVEVGQVASLIHDEPSAALVLERMVGEWREASQAARQRHDNFDRP